jgi:serine/threonine-protein kinase
MVKILDFGVAKILAAPDGSQSVKTRTGSLMGTPLYMSPEQCKGAGLLDHRTDIYSLGVMIFEMLAGRPPFVAEGIGELFAKHMLEEAPSLLEFAPNTPPNMAAAVNKSLNKELDDRFSSMEEFRKALLGETQVAASSARTPAPKRGTAMGTRSVPASQTMSPQAQSTTLSSATSEIDDIAPPKRKTGLFVGLGLVAAGAAAFFALQGGGDKTPAPAPVAKAPVAAAPSPPPPPAAPKTVTIRFEATPEGARVIRKSDGMDLGAAPLELELQKDGPAVEYTIRKDGYKDLPLSTDLDNDHTLHVALEKVAPPPEAPKAASDSGKKKPSGGHKSGKHKPAGPVPDEDGLATPSF